MDHLNSIRSDQQAAIASDESSDLAEMNGTEKKFLPEEAHNTFGTC